MDSEKDSISSIKVEWEKAAVLKLINLWQDYPCLYNPRDIRYHNKHARNDALQKMSLNLQEDMPGLKLNDVKIKINYLRNQYSREMQKQRETTTSGMGADEVYIPSAYWYEHLLFLQEFIKIRKGKSNIEVNLISEEDDGPSPAKKKSPSITQLDKHEIEASEEDDAIKAATAALQSFTKQTLTDSYIESFVNFVKQNLSIIQNKRQRHELIQKIMFLIFEFINQTTDDDSV